MSAQDLSIAIEVRDDPLVTRLPGGTVSLLVDDVVLRFRTSNHFLGWVESIDRQTVREGLASADGLVGVEGLLPLQQVKVAGERHWILSVEPGGDLILRLVGLPQTITRYAPTLGERFITAEPF
jgi:hypothetical protein